MSSPRSVRKRFSGFEIAMHDPERVRLGHACACLTDVVDGDVDGETAGLRQLLAEVVSDQQLHRDVGLSGRQPVDVEDACDVRAS